MYSREKILKAFDEFVKKYGRLPKQAEFNSRYNFPTAQVAKQFIGNLTAFYKENYPELYVNVRNEFKRECVERYKKRRGSTDDEFRDELLNKLDKFVVIHNRPPKLTEFKVENGLASKNTFIKYLGEILPLLRQRYPQFYKNEWTAEKIKRCVDTFVIRHQRHPRIQDFTEENHLPKYSIFCKMIGTLSSTMREWYPEYEGTSIRYTKEDIYPLLDKFVEKHGRMPTSSECIYENKLPRYSTIIRYCGKLEDIRKERYGWLSPCFEKWNKEKILARFDEFVETHKRLPKSKDMGSKNFMPSTETVKRHLGDIIRVMKLRYPEYEIPIRHQRTRWDQEKAINAIKEFVKFNGYLPKTYDFTQKNHLPSKTTMAKLFGGISQLYYGRLMSGFGSVFFEGDECWDEERIKIAVEEFRSKYHRLPKCNEFKAENNLPSMRAIYKCFGYESLRLYYAIHFPREVEYSKEHSTSKWNREKIINVIDKFIEREGRLPLAKEFRKENGLPSNTIFAKLFKTTRLDFFEREYSHLIYTLNKNSSVWDEEKILDAIRKFIEKNKRFPSKREFTGPNNLPTEKIVNKHFGSVNSLREEYFQDAKFNGVWTEKDILLALLKFKETHNRFPKIVEWRNRYGLPSYSAVSNNREFINKVKKEYFKENSNNKIKWHKEKILDVIDEFVKREKRLPSYKDFYKGKESGLPSAEVFESNFGDWRTMLKERYPQYGFKDDKMKFASVQEGRDAIVKAIDEFVKENGRPPKSDELAERTNISRVTMSKYLGMPIGKYCKEKYFQSHEETDMEEENIFDDGMCMMM